MGAAKVQPCWLQGSLRAKQSTLSPFITVAKHSMACLPIPSSSFSATVPHPVVSLSPSPPPPPPQSARRKHCCAAAVSESAVAPAFDPRSVPPEEKEPGKGERAEKFDWNAHWYPVFIAADLDKRVPHPALILGKDLVVWWDRVGNSWQVFEDRCPHRQAPLSEGRIDEQGQLQCCYHGWTFAPSSGACTRIPQAPTTDSNPVWQSKRACATVYPCTEKLGIIWFWPDANATKEEIQEKEPVPSVPVLSDPEFVYELSMRDLYYGYEQLVENLTDPSHVPFAHHGLQGNRNLAKPLNYKVEKLDKDGFVGKGERGPAHFTAPCIFTLDSLFQSPQPKDGSDSKKARKKVVLVFICIPVSPGKSRLIWAFPRNFGQWLEYIVPQWFSHRLRMLVLDSDLYMLHLAERRLEDGKKSWDQLCYMPTTADTFVIAFRKWLKVYAGGAPDWGGRYDNKLPVSPSKRQLLDRYHSHVVHCRHCRNALRFFEGLKIVLEVLPVVILASLGAAAVKPIPQIRAWSIPLMLTAIAFCIASKWLSHFIQKTYHFHDYNHALVK